MVAIYPESHSKTEISNATRGPCGKIGWIWTSLTQSWRRKTQQQIGY